ncbi:unnamed protein product, partial [Prorocentrum cordatum]
GCDISRGSNCGKEEREGRRADAEEFSQALAPIAEGGAQLAGGAQLGGQLRGFAAKVEAQADPPKAKKQRALLQEWQEKLEEKATEVAKKEAPPENIHGGGRCQPQSSTLQLITRTPEQLALDAAKLAVVEAAMKAPKDLQEGAKSCATQLQERTGKAKELAAKGREAFGHNAKKRGIDAKESREEAHPPPSAVASSPAAGAGGGGTDGRMTAEGKGGVDMEGELRQKAGAEVAGGAAPPGVSAWKRSGQGFHACIALETRSLLRVGRGVEARRAAGRQSVESEGCFDVRVGARIHALPVDMLTCYRADAEPFPVDLARASPGAFGRFVDLEPVADVSWSLRVGQKLRVRAEIKRGVAGGRALPRALCRPELGARRRPNLGGEGKGGPSAKHRHHRACNDRNRN